MPTSACTLSRSMFRSSSSDCTANAFFMNAQPSASCSPGMDTLLARIRQAMARATFRLAHQPEASYGSGEYCRSMRCMKVGSWNKGKMTLKFSKNSAINDKHSSRGGSSLNIRLWKMSPNTSGRQWNHLLSSTELWTIMF